MTTNPLKTTLTLLFGLLATSAAVVSGSVPTTVQGIDPGAPHSALMATPSLDADARAAAVAAANEAAVYHAGTAGATLTTVTLEGSPTPSTAASRWLSIAAATQVDASSLASLDALSPDVASALARVIDAFAALDGAARVAYDRDATVQVPPTPDALAQVLAAQQAVLAAAVDLDAAVAVAAALSGTPDVAAVIKCDNIDLPFLLYVDFIGCDTPQITGCILQDYALVIDVGGNDEYCNNAGGTGDDIANGGGSYFAAAMINLGGDDRYEGGLYGRYFGINGGGHFGVGTLFDSDGTDLYYAGRMGAGEHSGVNGAGIDSGVGFLLDVAGDDVYRGGWGGSNGGGAYDFAHGNLIDLAGNDLYTSMPWTSTNPAVGRAFGAVNGGGFADGYGNLRDVAGHDLYFAGSAGVNGGGYCGTGRLQDDDGMDLYDARYAGVNGGAFAGSGFLRDERGDDRYIALGTGSNGWAIGTRTITPEMPECETPFLLLQQTGALSLAILYDHCGRDSYQDNYAGASGTDRTVLNKQTGLLAVGHQLDADPSPGTGC